MTDTTGTTSSADLHPVMAAHVAGGVVPGLVTALARDGQVQVDTIGTTAVDATEPMRRDTIFRITSMTKPVVAAAVLMLAEQGALRLDEPVDRLLPELARPRVLVDPDGPLDDTVAARRAITVEDLLTFRLGFGIDMAMPSAGSPISAAITDNELAIGPPLPPSPHDPDEWLRRLGSLPLLAQPGERWLYDTGADVAGVLVARASGMSLADFLTERILGPLGMTDTGFHVPPEQVHRLAVCHSDAPPSDAPVSDVPAPVRYDDGGYWTRPPVFPSGGAGLVSTVDDCVAFGRMLAEGGGTLLSSETVRRMTTDQLTAEQHGSMILGDRGWGLGIAVDPAGRFGWDGGFGTTWFADPATGGVAVLLTQRLFSGPMMGLLEDFRTTAAGAIGG